MSDAAVDPDLRARRRRASQWAGLALSLLLIGDLAVLILGASGAQAFVGAARVHAALGTGCQLLLLWAAWLLVRGPGRGQPAAEAALGLAVARWLILGLGLASTELPGTGEWVGLLDMLLPAAVAVALWRRLQEPPRFAAVLVEL